MKKLMFVAAAIAAGVAVADVTSANVVGYVTADRPADFQNFAGGSMFVNCGSGEGYTLADIKISGPTTKSNGRGNFICFMKSGVNPLVDKDRSFWWDPVALAWRVRSGTNFNNDPTVADPTTVKINPGEGFLCNFGQATTKVTFAGAVIQGKDDGKSDARFEFSRPEGMQNFIASNVSGSEITLADIQISGPTTKSNGRGNFICFMKTGVNPLVDKERSYWWDPVALTWRIRSGTNFNNDPTLTDPTTVKIPVGQGFLCNFGQATTVLSMPTSL